ncbi:MAG: penicillin-binding protein 2 [Kastovskya adunca ATA6-11-RM4]|jgi:cell division protein FtsI (penicillin-binding protein 3)|nr:penicillin-binding protein 2 [Kastovskya adunca ATA6-11-RM4]
MDYELRQKKANSQLKAGKRQVPLKRKKLSQLPRVRLLLVWGLMIAGIFGLALNLYSLQVSQASSLEQKARNQQMVYLRPFVPRRPIVDREGNILAVDRAVYTLYAHPKLFKKTKTEMAAALSPILSSTPADLEAQFNKRSSGIRIAHALSEEMADQVSRLQADGLELIRQYSRFYPQKDLAADVVGYVDIDHRGQAGVEYSQESLLERTVRTLRLSRAGNGLLMPDHVPEGFLHFDELRLQLTIDSRLQRAARSALKEKIEQFNAKRGAVIVMDVRDGSLLALVAEPTYDPNEYSKFDVSLFKNWALTDLYEPGSTFKPINVAIALEANAIEPNSVFSDPGQIQVADRQIFNFDKRGRGSISITEILQHSSNVGMVKIMQRVKSATYYDWLERLGLGHPMESDLPFAATSQLKSQKQFSSSPVEAATTSFGQGFSLTPIQLVQLQATLANGGKLVTPHVVKGLFDTKGQLYWQPSLPAPKQVFSPTTAKTVVEMMESVVTDGSGQNAQIADYRIGGKTGTAQKASPRGGYYSNAKITSFVGILPIEAPRYAVVAVVDEPKGDDAFGSSVAAPIVKSVMEALITIERIPPSPQEAEPTP